MVADAAFARAPRVVVLHAKSLEDFDTPVVHFDGQVERKRPARRAQHFAQAGIQFELFRGPIKLAHRYAKRVEVFGGLGTGFHGSHKGRVLLGCEWDAAY